MTFIFHSASYQKSHSLIVFFLELLKVISRLRFCQPGTFIIMEYVCTVCVLVCVYCVCMLSHVRLFAAQWTIVRQTPLSMEFSRKNIGAGCHFLLQEIFPTQGSNLPLCVSCIGRRLLYQLSHQGSPVIMVSNHN